MSRSPDPDFRAAADRHLHDARLLYQEKRLANSDHLAGFAAECALKAILVGHLGCTVGENGIPMHPDSPGKQYRYHVQSLWQELEAFAHGRTGSTFASMITESRPFARWEVNERYSDGSHIDVERVNAHLEAARRTLAVHQQACMDGALL